MGGCGRYGVGLWGLGPILVYLSGLRPLPIFVYRAYALNIGIDDLFIASRHYRLDIGPLLCHVGLLWCMFVGPRPDSSLFVRA